MSVLSLAVGLLASAHAADKTAAPTLDHLYPVAAIAGATTSVAAVGKFAPWPPQVWVDAPGISFRTGEKAAQFNVDVSPEVPPGPHLVRFFNEAGASAPRFLIVAKGPEQTETEPNDDFAKAPLIEQLPTTINGRLNKNGDVDCYTVRLEAGQTLAATLDAYVLGSPVDAVLRVLDARGLEQALNHDNGRNPDPAIRWTATTAGSYIVQVFGFAHPASSEVRFTGSDACVYRLHIETGSRRPDTGELSSQHSPVSGSRFPVSELTEQEYRARFDDASTPSPPFAVTGCIEKIGEQDRFSFEATKDDKLVLAVESSVMGFPLDAWLAIQNSAGKELARNDDGTTADPVLEWTAPENGTYVAVVGGVLHRAGPDYRYRLSIRSAQPAFQGVIAESGFTVEPGKSIKIKVTARRIEGFKRALTASVAGLPDGLTAAPVEMKEADKEITLEVAAGADAGSFNGPIQIIFRDAGTDTVYYGVHELVSTTSRNGVPQGFRDLVIASTNQLWLTVRSAKPPPEPADK